MEEENKGIDESTYRLNDEVEGINPVFEQDNCDQTIELPQKETSYSQLNIIELLEKDFKWLKEQHKNKNK